VVCFRSGSAFFVLFLVIVYGYFVCFALPSLFSYPKIWLPVLYSAHRFALSICSSAMTTPFFLGTASWTFPDWRRVFYPDGLADRERLAWYATQANSVEVNTSFYGLPAPSTLVQWVESVPPGFTFSLSFVPPFDSMRSRPSTALRRSREG